MKPPWVCGPTLRWAYQGEVPARSIVSGKTVPEGTGLRLITDRRPSPSLFVERYPLTRMTFSSPAERRLLRGFAAPSGGAGSFVPSSGFAAPSGGTGPFVPGSGFAAPSGGAGPSGFVP